MEQGQKQRVIVQHCVAGEILCPAHSGIWRQIRIGDQIVDTGALRDDEFQIRQSREQSVDGRAHHDDVDIVAVVEIEPVADFFIGKGVGEGGPPRRRPLG